MAKLPASIEREIGTSASFGGAGGWVFDPSEDNPELQWPHSVLIFDLMRKQDPQIMGTLNAITLPLRQAQWSIDPMGAKPEVAQLIADDLGLPVMGEEPAPRPRMRDRFSWAEHLRLALLELIYGHMPFEQVYRIVDGPTGDPMARLRKLAPRFPRSLLKINTDTAGGLASIVQWGTGLAGGKPQSDPIPVDRLAYYVNEREGAAWQGNSILRSVYRSWTLKDRLLRVASMTIERNGMGVPTIENTQPGLNGEQLAAQALMAERYRAGDMSGAALPYGARLRLVGVEGTLPDPLPLIRYHDEQITRPMLEMFMQLGSTETGSRALGASFIDFFTMALNALAVQIIETTTEHVIEDIVDLNFGADAPAPALHVDVLDAEEDIPPESLVALLRSGAVEMDDDLDTFLRKKYRLPVRGDGDARQIQTGTGAPPKDIDPVTGLPTTVTARRRHPFKYR